MIIKSISKPRESKIKHNYIVGEFYEKTLKIKNSYMLKGRAYVIFEDTDGVILTWITSEENKSGITMIKGKIVHTRFKVKDIFVSHSRDTTIWIGYAKRIKREAFFL